MSHVIDLTCDLSRDQHVECVLRIADTSLILGQRLSELLPLLLKVRMCNGHVTVE